MEYDNNRDHRDIASHSSKYKTIFTYQRNLDLSVQSAGTKEGGIKNIGPVVIFKKR